MQTIALNLKIFGQGSLSTGFFKSPITQRKAGQIKGHHKNNVRRI